MVREAEAEETEAVAEAAELVENLLTLAILNPRPLAVVAAEAITEFLMRRSRLPLPLLISLKLLVLKNVSLIKANDLENYSKEINLILYSTEEKVWGLKEGRWGQLGSRPTPPLSTLDNRTLNSKRRGLPQILVHLLTFHLLVIRL